jgi:hypothetical protein
MEHGELEEKRSQVCQDVLKLREEILSGSLLDWLSKPFKTGSKKYWSANFIFLNLIVLGPWLLIGYTRDEFNTTRYLWISGPMTIEFVILGFILAHIETQRMLNDIPALVIHKLTDACDISEFGKWLKKSLSTGGMAVFVSIVWAGWVLLGIAGQSTVHKQFVGFGLSVTLVFEGLLAAIALYTVYWITRTAYQLRKYTYEPNRFSPADSEIVHNIYELIKKGAYGFSIYFAIFFLTSSTNLVDINSRMIFAWPAFLIIWTVMITQYLVTRDTAKVIVDRQKWKTLNKLTSRINLIEETGDLTDQATAEKLLRLGEIHRQIVTSRTNTFDLNSLASLLSQLMLPVVGLALGYSDKVSEFFHWLSRLAG